MKRKFSIYANCQGPALADLLMSLDAFAAEFEYVPIKPVYLMTIEDAVDFKDLAATLDLIIAQPVTRTFRNTEIFWYGNFVRNTKTVLFLNQYFRGYNPELVYLKEDGAPVPEDCAPFHDKNIMSLYADNKFSKPAFVDACENLLNVFDPSYEDAISASVRELQRREVNAREESLANGFAVIDYIETSQFIEASCKTSKLFHTFNHPSVLVVEKIASDIIRALGLEWEAGGRFKDRLDFLRFPMYECAKSVFRNFELPRHYYLNRDIRRRDMYSTFFDIYERIGRTRMRNIVEQSRV